LHDYYTTCTDIDIDRYRHTHTHTHTYTHTYTYTHTTHTHTHTYTHTHTTQEAANYVAAKVRRAARSDKVRYSRSASCSKKRRTTFMRT
jgi:hypothetical protein